mgnify:CR=1 FL=1
MKEIFLQISSRQDLSQDQVQAVFNRILKNEVSESQIAAFLMGLKTKGETADEITGIVVTSLIALTFRQLFALS